MACASRSVISIAANSSSFSFKTHQFRNKFGRIDASRFKIRASSVEPEDCNVEECAPDKEVGKVSVEWLAGEKTMVAGTFPPRKKAWSGYVEKDTAGQTNIYSVEPTVYIAESAISSGTAGSSSDGAENTSAIAAFLALFIVAGASSILLQVGKNAPQMQTTVYSGPSLSYYITKFKPAEIIETSAPSPSESSSATESIQTESSSATESIQTESSSATESIQTESSSATEFIQSESSLATESSQSATSLATESIQSESSPATESQTSTPEVPQVPVDSGAELEPSVTIAENAS
ncbi:hypothetical protein SOVF_066850 [Spinacia oleracea]|uniref:Protein MAINTENANCE OF PSII UNDER HIGH LIGHT 1 n=1 Tax=Spinacia oleracea TaxID=3562 RepID=A0A9R0HUR5_SPIOL|nr:protein MAINTENANCE OF PSII UNDER HIGH LIGHT 1 [Spinacia oleracea]KNA18819.1 hypothetical protein SOVF_066850 [Spinacia oleracea]